MGQSGAGTGEEREPSDSDVDEVRGGEDLSPESAELTQADLDWSESAIEGLKSVLEDFAVVLLEIAGTPGGDLKADATLARSLSLVAERYLDDADVGSLDLIVNRVTSLVADGRRPPEFGMQVFGEAVTTTRLARVLSVMAQSPPDLATRIGALLGKMRDWVLPTLLEMLAESSDKSVRRIALELLEAEEGVPLVQLWPLMEDPRWYVVRNAVALATGSGDPTLVDHLEPLLRHSDARVRREVIRSLDTIGSQRSAGLLARVLTDSDFSVRVLAANALGRHGNRSHLGAVQAQIEARDFSTRPAEEITAFLVAYAALGSEATVEVLDKLWRRRMFGTKPLPLRLGAIQALGFVGAPSAQEALNQATKANETQIQRAAAKALADGYARMRGEVT
jgi:HEAT repeat protein